MEKKGGKEPYFILRAIYLFYPLPLTPSKRESISKENKPFCPSVFARKPSSVSQVDYSLHLEFLINFRSLSISTFPPLVHMHILFLEVKVHLILWILQTPWTWRKCFTRKGITGNLLCLNHTHCTIVGNRVIKTLIFETMKTGQWKVK